MNTKLSPVPDFFLALLDASVGALCAFDASGHFVVCNAAFEALFFIDAAALSGCTEAELRMLLAPRLCDNDAFLVMPEPNETQEITVEFLDRREKRRRETADDYAAPPILLWRSAPMNDISGALCGRLVTQRDITREVQADRAKDDFIAIVSHELRTPMTSIKGYVDLILDGDTGEINGLQREFLTTVRRNTRRLVEMVNDILDISRIEAGGIELELRPVILQDVVTQALEIIQPQANAKNLRLETHLPESVRVLGDFDRILQIFTNLLSNAVKYTPAPPASEGLVQILIEEKNSVARIAVRDSGIGLTEDDQKLLFQKFFRADNPTTRDAGGTGLGLVITRALIEKMGGELHVWSEVGRGSEFSFALPLIENARRAMAATPRVLAPDENAPRVLVVDDDPDIVDLVGLFLQRGGYRTAAAYSGAEALRLLRAEPFDAMTLDLLMPHMDGFEVLRALKDDDTLRQLPVIVASVQSDATPTGVSPEERKLHLASYDFLTKPFDEAALHATLSRVLAARRELASPREDAENPTAKNAARRQKNPSSETVSSPAQSELPLVLLVDSGGAFSAEVNALLSGRGARIEHCASPVEALARAGEERVDLIVLDAPAWGDQTLELVEALEHVETGTPFVLFIEPDTSGQYVVSAQGESEYSRAESSPVAPPALDGIRACLDEVLAYREARIAGQEPQL